MQMKMNHEEWEGTRCIAAESKDDNGLDAPERQIIRMLVAEVDHWMQAFDMQRDIYGTQPLSGLEKAAAQLLGAAKTLQSPTPEREFLQLVALVASVPVRSDDWTEVPSEWLRRLRSRVRDVPGVLVLPHDANWDEDD